MSPLEQAVIRRKLQHLQELVMLLRAESTTGLADFLSDRRQQLLVERLLHLSVEAASDLLVQGSGRQPQTYADTFIQAGQAGLISPTLAQRLVPAAGLRNRLVHDYEAIDPSRVHAAMGIALADLDELVGQLSDQMAI